MLIPGPLLAFQDSMQKYHRKYTDKDLLVSLLINAISSLEERLQRNPSPEEVLNDLFSEDREDPEAMALAEKLEPFLMNLLEDWALMDEFATDEDDQYVSHPRR